MNLARFWSSSRVDRLERIFSGRFKGKVSAQLYEMDKNYCSCFLPSLKDDWRETAQLFGVVGEVALSAWLKRCEKLKEIYDKAKLGVLS
jgi:hypothetical protein